MKMKKISNKSRLFIRIILGTVLVIMYVMHMAKSDYFALRVFFGSIWEIVIIWDALRRYKEK